jgi:type IV pilus assembly protein PilM
MFGLKKKEKRVISKVGVDIGSKLIKIVELEPQAANKYKLLNYAVENNDPTDFNQQVESLKNAFAKAKFLSHTVNFSVSGPSVIVRYITLPKMAKNQLTSAIRFEAEKFIPFDIKDVIIDSPVLEELANENKTKVLVVAAKKNFIEEKVKLVRAAGLEPDIIDVDSFALIKAFLLNMPNEKNAGITALLNIGAKFTNINILRDGISHFMRDIGIGGVDLTKALSDRLGLDLLKAEELKCNPGERHEEVLEAVKNTLNNLIGEISLSFSYYEDQLERGIDKVFLSGGTTRLKGIDKFFSESLGLEVNLWQPAKILELDPSIDKALLESDESLLGISIGLALGQAE